MPEGGIHAGPEPGRFLKPGEYKSKGAAGKSVIAKATVGLSKTVTPGKKEASGTATGSSPAPAAAPAAKPTRGRKPKATAAPAAGPNHPGVSTATNGTGEGSSEGKPLGRFQAAALGKINNVMEHPFFKAVSEKAASDRQAVADAEAAKKQEAADAEASKNQQWYDRQNHAHKNLTERMSLQAKLAEEKAAAAHARKLELLNSRQQAGAKPVVAPTAGSSPFSPGSKGTLDLGTMTGGTAAAPAAAPVAEPAAKPARGRKPKAAAPAETPVETPATPAPANKPARGKAAVKPGTPSTGGIMSKFDASR